MPINIFETRTMIDALEQMKPARTFLLDTFFKDFEEHDTVIVDIDIIKGKRKIAPFVNPRAQGKLIERAGYQTKTYKPPYIKPKMVTTAQDLLIRAPGDTIYSRGTSIEQRAAEQLGKDLADMDSDITRNEEWQAAQGIVTGQIVVQGDGVDDLIDFGMDPNHLVVLTGTDCWDDAGSKPLTDLRTWKRKIIQDSGVSPDTAVFGAEAIDAFLDHEGVKDALDSRRIDLGMIDPEELPEGVTYYGYLKVPGIDIYGYDEWYLDDAGVEQPMIPEQYLIMGSKKAVTKRHYGMIQDIEAGANFAVKRYPKTWIESDPGVRWVMVQSAALVVPHQIDAFISAKVIADE